MELQLLLMRTRIVTLLFPGCNLQSLPLLSQWRLAENHDLLADCWRVWYFIVVAKPEVKKVDIEEPFHIWQLINDVEVSTGLASMLL